MPRNLKTQAQLQAQISKLNQENTHLRTLLRVILDTAHLAVNGKEEEKETEQPFNLPSCANCGKAIKLETNQAWKYEPDAGIYLCEDCLKPKKEVNRE